MGVNRSFRSRRATWIYATAALLGAVNIAAHAQGTANDGAVGINARWEQGKSTQWWIEEQRSGVLYVEAGVREENPSLIAQGLKQLDWGFAHEATDGSFPGTGDGTVAAAFHSTSLFAEAAARATLALKSYAPVTYSLPPGGYATVVANYTGRLHAVAQWLTQPMVARAGQLGNGAYAHRRWVLAATLAQIGALTGDAGMSQAGTSYALDGLLLQLGPGWRAALYQKPDGSVPPATLIPPGQDVPTGTWRVLNAGGVNPERYGYDVSYQAVGLTMAERYLAYCADPAMQSRVKAMLDAGLGWESNWVAPDGSVDTTGSTRVGIELTRDGTVKHMDVRAAANAFLNGAAILGRPAFASEAQRIQHPADTFASVTVTNNGAVGTNATAGTAKIGWSLSVQSIGADMIRAGVERENDNFIRRGIAVLDWAFSHQGADGTFDGAPASFRAISQFVAEAGRAALLLKSYNPTLYQSDAAFYAGAVTRYAAGVGRAANWMTANVGAAWYSDAASVSSRYVAGLAFQEAAALTGKASFASTAETFIHDALARQWKSGINPENGTGDVSLQAYGIVSAARYALLADAKAQPAIDAMILAGLGWEAQFVAVDGTVSGKASPSYRTIDAAFDYGADLTGSRVFAVVEARIADNQL